MTKRTSPATAFLMHPLLWTAVLFAVLPFIAGANPFAGKWSGFVGIATTMVIFTLFAGGWNLLFGHVGELSFGHAMFFTIGAYATALYSKGFDVQVFGLHLAKESEHPGIGRHPQGPVLRRELLRPNGLPGAGKPDHQEEGRRFRQRNLPRPAIVQTASR